MSERSKRLRLGLALIVSVVLAAVPCMGDQKLSLFNPFTLQTETVVAADSTPSVQLSDLLLLADGVAGGALGDEDVRPTLSLRGQNIRIPSRPSLRSAFS